PGDTLGPREVGGGLVTARLTLACVVHEKLRDFSECPTFLAIVDDESGTAGLSLAHAFLDAVREIRAAGADVRPENVGAIALIVDAACEWPRRIVNGARVTENIERHTANGGQEHVQITTRHQLGIHAAGLLEKGTPQVAFTH